MLRARSVVVVLLTTIAVLMVSAPPASAHGAGHDTIGNQQVTVSGIEPAVPGLEVRVVGAGTALELVNRTGLEVVVLGYEGEPYLRLDAEGVARNRRSPATYLNADRYARSGVPPGADPQASPVWEQVSTGARVRWHDHRIHWMAPTAPPAVRADPGRAHVVIDRWEVALLVDGRPVTLTGSTTWLPAPSPLPWFAMALTVALGVAAWSAHHRRRLVAALVVGAVAAGVAVVSGLLAVSAGAGPLAVGLAPMLAVASLALGSWFRPEAPAPPLIGATVLLVTAFGRVEMLDHPVVEAAVGVGVTRAVLAVALGIGAGTVVGGLAGLVGWRARRSTHGTRATAGALVTPAAEPWKRASP